MAGLPDEDGPTMSAAELEAAVRAEAADDDVEDGPTMQAAAPDVVAAPPRPDSKPRLAPPRPASKPKIAPAPPPPPAAPAPEEEEQDSITATAPRVDPAKIDASKGLLPAIEGAEEVETEVKTMSGPTNAAILAVLASVTPETTKAAVPADDDDPATMTAQAPSPSAKPETVASPLGEDPDDDEDGATVSTTAPAAAKASSPDLGSVGSVRISTKALMDPPTLPGPDSRDVPTKPGLGSEDVPTKSGITGAPDTAKEYEPEDSITSRAMAAHADDYEEERSVTAQAVAPNVGPAAGRMPTPLGDDSDADETQKKAAAPASPADDEKESITTQAPGHLTNMLRVIASDVRKSDAALPPAFEDDEPPENKTAVMPNAPLKGSPGSVPKQLGTLQGMGPIALPNRTSVSPIHPSIGAILAQRPDAGSESGLRVAPDAATSGEHASLGSIMGMRADERMPSGRLGPESEARLAHGPTEPAMYPLVAPPEDALPPRAPRYGLLVTVVAAISVVVPVVVWVALHRAADDVPVPGVPTQPSSDVVKRGDPVRPKAPKPAASTKGGSKHR